MVGWIKLYREIVDHWIWKDSEKLKHWIDLLIIANHEDKKVPIGFELIDCKRGQTLMSLQTLSKRWMISRESVRCFLDMLEKDHMITRKILAKTTQITICNYDTYQGIEHNDRTKSRRMTGQKADDDRTMTAINNKDKKEENDEEGKEDTSDAGSSLHSDFIKIYCDWYSEKVGVKYKFQKGQDAAAVKSIRQYISGAIETKNGSTPDNQEILQGWEFILKNWDKWELFYQKQLKISQVNSNLPNIMANIKGINGKQSKPSAAEIFNEHRQIIYGIDGKV